MRRLRFALLALGTALATACATNSGPLPTGAEILARAEQEISTGAYQKALDQLGTISGLQCPKRLRDRRDLAIAQAELGIGQPWRAYLALEEFSSRYPHSQLRNKAINVIWNAGKMLVDSDGGFLFFWSDRRAGRTVLEHLVTRHPETQRFADALRILGDMAFADGDYDTAQERYKDIILNRPDSEWRFHAQFRFAMSIVKSLRGPDYDLDRMELAVRELRGFLNNKPEDPQMIAATNNAIQQIKDWQVQRHLRIADFYRTLKSRNGVRHHLKLATRPEFEDVPAYQQALLERARLEQEDQANADPAASNPAASNPAASSPAGGQR